MNKIYEAILLKRRSLCSGTFEIELSRPKDFAFQAGQCIRILNKGQERDYSLACGPEDSVLALCIREVPKGTVSAFLGSLPEGARLSFSGPHGHFTFRPSSRHAVFVATGTGVAPFVSMVRSGVRGFTLLHGVRRPEEVHYQDVLKASAFKMVACLSRAPSDHETAAEEYPGRVTDYVKGHLPRRAYDFYLCGREEMIRDVTLTVDELFPDSRVFSEIFF